jgi:transcriptional regulator with XRE-family HTH domain
MNIKLGAKLRQLRTERGITQEALAQEIGVSFQAVSKWETDTTTPDIALLPDLAKFFAVTLDDLFSLTPDDHIEKIDAMLRDDFIITDENFTWAERYLKGALSDNARDNDIRVRLIGLYNHRADRTKKMAWHFAREGINVDANDVRFHRMFYNACRQGGDLDRLISFYKNEAASKAQNRHAVQVMIEAYLETHQPQKARVWLEKLEPCFDRFLYEGDILLADGDESAAKTAWRGAEQYAEKYQDTLHIAKRFYKLHDDDAAIEFYQKSGEARTPKGALDYAYALAFIYDRQGRPADAIAMWENILAVLASDWDTTSGESVDWPLREIARLRAL